MRRPDSPIATSSTSPRLRGAFAAHPLVVVRALYRMWCEGTLPDPSLDPVAVAADDELTMPSLFDRAEIFARVATALDDAAAEIASRRTSK